MNGAAKLGTVIAISSVVLLVSAPGCGSETGAGGASSGGTSSSGSSGFGSTDGGPAGCQNLQCQQVTCPGGGKTTVTGVVKDPAGKVPLYNVTVYVPNEPVGPLPSGASCDRCGGALLGNPIATAITNVKGEFTLENVPVGKDIPIVVQVGKWRRQLKLPEVKACENTPITNADETRLPRNKREGDIPLMALTTGGADPLECLLKKMGIDIEEFTQPDGGGRVNLFGGNGGSQKYRPQTNGGVDFPNADPTLYGTAAALKKYDLVLLACEGGGEASDGTPVGGSKRDSNGGGPVEQRTAMRDYLDSGGRVFASHWHHYWLHKGVEPLNSGEIATYEHKDKDLKNPIDVNINLDLPKGAALADWLLNVASVPKPRGTVQILAAQQTVVATGPLADTWLKIDNAINEDNNPAGRSIQSFTVNTPVGKPAAEQCGRIAVTDLHVSDGGNAPDKDVINVPFPDGCKSPNLSDQEKVLEFMIFDLSACVQSDKEAPTAPPVVK